MTTLKELTPAEALAGVKENETIQFANCPNCNQRLAVYIGQDKPDDSPVSTGEDSPNPE